MNLRTTALVDEVEAVIRKGDADEIAEALQLNIAILMERMPNEALSALESIPPELDRVYPALRLMRPDAYIGRALEIEEEELARLVAQASDSSQASVDRVRLLLTAVIVARSVGEVQQTLRCAQLLEAEMNALDHHAKERLVVYLPHIYIQLGITHALRWKLSAAMECFTVAAQSAKLAGSEYAYADSLAKIAMIAVFFGSPQEADSCLLELSELPLPSEFFRGFIESSTNLARVLQIVDQGGDASKILRALDLQVLPNEFWVLGVYTRGMAALSQGRPREVFGLLGRRFIAGHRSSSDFPLVQDVLSSLEIEAKLALGIQPENLSSDSFELPGFLTRIAMIKSEIYSDPSRAAEMAEELLEEPGVPDFITKQALLLRGWCAYAASGQSRLNTDEVTQILLEGSTRLWLTVPASYVRSQLLLSPTTEGEELDRLLRTRRSAPEMASFDSSLTEREQLILSGIARGLTNPEIAAEIFVSTHTVKSDLLTLFRKLRVAKRQDAARIAKARGLI